MKLKSKLGALLVAVTMATAGLVGCGGSKDDPKPEPTPTPEPGDNTKYKVAYDTSEYYSISGLNAEGYLKGSTVTFAVTATKPEEKEIKSVEAFNANKEVPLNKSENNYTFTMPDHKVDIVVTLRTIEKFELSYEGLAQQYETISVSLEKGGVPYTGEFEIKGKTAADEEKVTIEDDQVTLDGYGEVTLVAIVDEKEVAELTFEIDELVITTIDEAQKAAIKEAPFNGKTGRDAAITTTTFNIEGEVLAVNDYEGKTSMNVLLGDNTGYLYLMVSYKAGDAIPFEVGSSVRVSTNLTNYYGLFEGISKTAKTGDNGNYIALDDFKVINRAFDDFEPVAMDGEGYNAYYERAKQIAAKKDGTGTEYVEIEYVSIPVQLATINNGLAYNVMGTQYTLEDITAFEFDKEAEGQQSILDTFLIGANTSKGKSNVMTIAQRAKAVEEVVIDETPSTTMYVNNTLQLAYTTSPEGSYGEAKWESSDEEVAAVDENGLVTALKEGEVTITVTVDGCSDTIELNVSGELIPADSVSFITEATELEVGDELALEYETVPETITSIPTFSSSDEEVATVSEDGVVTALKKGETTITISVDGKTDTVIISVKDVHGTVISDALTVAEAIDVCKGITGEGDVASELSYYTHGVLTEGSYDTGYKNITGSMGGLGLYRITTDTGVEGEKIHVGSDLMVYGQLHNRYGSTYQYSGGAKVVQYLSINQEKIEAMVGDPQVELGVDTNLVIAGAVVQWESANEEVVTVNSEGLVTIVGAGETVISATYGDFMATCAVSVAEPGMEKATIVAADFGLENQQELTTLESDPFTLTFSKGTGNNAPKYYNTGNAFRTYQGNTMTIELASGTMKSIKLGFASGENDNEVTADSGEYADGVWTGEASSVTFTIGMKSDGNNGGHRRIATIEIQYVEGESGEVLELEGNAFAFKEIVEKEEMPLGINEETTIEFLEDGVVEMNTKVQVSEELIPAVITGTYAQDGENFTVTLLKMTVNEEEMDFPPEIAELLKDMSGVIEGEEITIEFRKDAEGEDLIHVVFSLVDPAAL